MMFYRAEREAKIMGEALRLGRDPGRKTNPSWGGTICGESGEETKRRRYRILLITIKD